MNRFLWRITLLLFLFVLLYFLHWTFLSNREVQLSYSFLLFSYLINMGVVIFYLFLFYKVLAKLKIPMGIYLIVSMCTKAVLYFLYFQPFFKEDGSIQRYEFLIFFIPYLYALFFGVWLLAQIIGDLEENQQVEE